MIARVKENIDKSLLEKITEHENTVYNQLQALEE